MSKSDGGKGSSPRPYSVTQQEYDARWDAIFGKDSVEDYKQSENVGNLRQNVNDKDIKEDKQELNK